MAMIEFLACSIANLGHFDIKTKRLSGKRMIAIQGPGALQALDDRTLWLGVNDELWVLDTLGTKRARKSAADRAKAKSKAENNTA